MSTTLALAPARQAAVLAAIAAIHVGAFILAAAGLRLPATVLRDWREPVYALPPPPVPARESPPDPVVPADFGWEPVEQPLVSIPDMVDPPPSTSGAQHAATDDTTGGAPTASPVIRAPALRTRDARLQALINSCYPSAARRLGQEGRGVARVDVDATGRTGGWSIEASTGFAQLDPGMGCVVRRVQFEPGRRDGSAIGATVLMPIEFRLD